MFTCEQISKQNKATLNAKALSEIRTEYESCINESRSAGILELNSAFQGLVEDGLKSSGNKYKAENVKLPKKKKWA